LVNGSGGGGSGYLNSAAVTSVAHQQGPNGVQQNFSYPLRSSDQWVSPAGVGGKAYTSTPAEAKGGHGMVVVQWALPPTARPDSATGGSATAITVLPASNDTGASGATINASSVRLCAPNDVAPVCAETSLTVVNEGTYSVNTTTGVVTFTGDAGFIGTSTVTYSIADSRGTRASSTISFTTLAPPTARPDASVAQRGDNQSASPLANDFANGSATLDLDSLRLCGISPVETSPSCTQTSISIADEGTYSISNGVVVFTADAQYTGTRVLHYIVRDSTSQVATSTITFTALPPPAVSASPESVTVEHATTASFTPLSNDSAGFIPSDYTTQGTVTLDVSSLKLCSAGETISTGCTKTSVVVAYEGTWSLSGSAVTFVPLTTFSGIATSMPYVVCNTVSGTWAPGTPPETCGSSVMSVTVNAPAAPVPEPDLLSAQLGNRTSIHPLANDQGTALSPSQMRLCDVTETFPACFSTTIFIINQGTWTLNTSTGLVEFAPLPLFTGTSTITYMASDIVGATFSSSISATIQAPALPFAQPDTATGTASSTTVLTPLLNDTGTGLSFTSLRLCSPTDTPPSCSELSLTVNNQGTWSINDSNGDITFTPEGGFTGTTTAVTYSVLDVLDRPTSSTITVTISAIAAPDTPSLLESSDTGASSTDNVTNDVTPAIRAHGVTDGETVIVTATDGTLTWTCTYVVSADDSECQLPPLSDGTWTITTTRTDSDDNISVASAPLIITIDTTPPDAPLAPVLDSASDDGLSSTDNITSVITPTVGAGSGASGETVTMTATQGSTSVSCTYDAATATSCELQTLSVGTWLVTAIITDLAGNDSASSPALTLVIESSTPVQNVPTTTPTTVPVTTTTTTTIPTTTTVPVTTTTLPNSQIPYTIAEKDKIINGVAAVAGMPKDGWVKVEKSDSSITITTSDGLLIRIGAKVKSSVTLRLNSRGMPIFEANDFITIAGGGLKPATPASTWLFSTPRQLGLLTTDSNGSFNEEYSIGADVEVGDHTAQLNGIAPDGTLRVVEIAVEIIAAPEDVVTVVDGNTKEAPPATPLNTPSTIALFASAFALLAISRQRINALTSQNVNRKKPGGNIASVKVSFGNRITDEHLDRIRVPRLQWIDNAMNRLACAIDRTSPMLARIADDGAYARSLLGLLWPLLPIAGVALGIVSAFNTEFVMMIPALSLVIAIAVLGVIDAFAGFMFVLSFGISMLIGGGFDSVDSLRGFLGIAVFSFAPVMIAAATRPFRRITTHTLSTWNRSVDFVLTALFGSWAGGKMYSALPSLTTYQPEHSVRVDLIHVVFLAAIALRWILENSARIYMPRRLRVVEVEEFEDTTRTQHVMSDIVRTAVFVFVASVFIGNNWALWTGAAMFFIPKVIAEFTDSFKNIPSLFRFVPRKLTRVVMMLFVGLWWGKLVRNQFGDSDNILLYAFVFLSIPGITLGALDWFGRDGKKWESTPLSRTLGVLVLIVGILSVRGFIP
jgi:CshA-type fibril repeat protein